MGALMTGTIWLIGIIAVLGPFVVHIWVTVATNWAALLILGLAVPPIGWIHGAGVLLGVWGWS